MNNNLEYYNKMRSVPKEATKAIEAGRLKGKSDINPMWRIRTLTETFGPCGIGWYYEITKQWQEQYCEEVKAFCNINLYVKIDGEWSKPIAGTGGSTLVEISKNGAYVNDEGFKMALTDALSVSMKSLGVAADIYFAAGASYGTKYESGNSNPAPTHAQKNVLKPASSLTDKEQDDLWAAIDEIKRCKSRDELDDIGRKWKGFYIIEEFVKAGQVKAQQLTNEGK